MKSFQSKTGKSMRRFPIRHHHLDELEPPLKDLFHKHLDPKEEIRHIITAPSQMVLGSYGRFRLFMPWTATPEWVLVMTSQRMLVATQPQPDAAPQLSEFSFADVLSMEMGRILLYAWIEWSWAGAQSVERLRVYFNSVGEHIFNPLVTDISRIRITRSGFKPATGDRNLGLLGDLTYKFRNLISGRLLLADEALQGVVFRPAIYSSLLWVLRTLQFPALALMRTQYHLLVMREDLGDAGSKYGVVFRYIPLDAVMRAELQLEEERLNLNVILQINGIEETVELVLLPEHEQALRQMLSNWMGH